MIMTRDAIKITRLKGLTIMQASKNFKSNRLLRIFGRSNVILNTFVMYLNPLGMGGYSVSARIIRRGIQVTKNSKAVSSMILGTTEIISGGARGVDTSARDFANANGIKLTEFLPQYEMYGRRAPIIRNITIIENADLVMAFWDGNSRGTKFVIEECRKRGVPVRIFIPKKPE